MNRNRTTTSRTSPGWAPPLWLLIAGTILVAAAGLLVIGRYVHDAQMQAAIHCPAPDHPVYASSLGQWLCGDSLNVGVKSK